MNAEEIYNKYVLKETPVVTPPELLYPDEIIIGARQSGRTTRAISRLTPGSIYVMRNWKQADDIISAVANQGASVLDTGRLCQSLRGWRAAPNAMILYDHFVYECYIRLEDEPFMRRNLEDALLIARRCGYDVEETQYFINKFKTEHIPDGVINRIYYP